MKVRVLPSSPDVPQLQHLVSFVVNGRLAIDAGCLGLCGTPVSQAAVTSVLLTHSHMDHVCSLPIFAINLLDATGQTLTVHAPPAVIASLRQDVFNGRLWPDLAAMTTNGKAFLEYKPIENRRPFTLDEFTVTAIPINHPVPTVGYLIDDGRSAVLFALDTGPTDEIFEAARANPRLKAAFIDTAFPDELEELALRSGHLTPSGMLAVAARLPEAVQKVASHLKPGYHDRIAEALRHTAVPNLSCAILGRDYEF